MALLQLCLLPLALLLLLTMPVLAEWKTLSGNPPLVIASGGTSGLYPDQTTPAYQDALKNSLPGVILSCDLQIARSLATPANGTGICRSGLNLNLTTTIGTTRPLLNKTYRVDGVSTLGWYAIDIPYETLKDEALAKQNLTNPMVGRTKAFDGKYPILKPEDLPANANPPGILSTAPDSTWWLNSEYTSFIEANSNFNATETTIELVQQYQPGYVSAPEIRLLQKIRAARNTTRTKAIYKFLDNGVVDYDRSTNQSYARLLQNLTYVRTFCSGILVPKSYIWPIDVTDLYLGQPSTLVQRAHSANLEVYVYNFANDQYRNSFNFTFDPIIELLYFIDMNFTVDGVFTENPTTASEAISCYASSSRTNSSSSQLTDSSQTKQTIMSHNGDSGQFPGSTSKAYESAIAAGVDYIDCNVQITSDSIPICRDTINLVETTDVPNSAFFQNYLNFYTGLNNDKPGVYPFDLSIDQVMSLKSISYSPAQQQFVYRDPSYNGAYGILTLMDVLEIARNNSVGLLIDIQNAVYIREAKNLAVVDAVVDTLVEFGYNSSDKVVMQSEDSSVLKRLRDLGITYPLRYSVYWNDGSPISINTADFAEISQFASSVSLDARLLEPYDRNKFLKGPPTAYIDMAHEQNLSVFFQVQLNEPVYFASDLQSDPTRQLFSLEFYGVDGIVTDFPHTVTNYRNSRCSAGGLQSNLANNFSIPLVVPGVLSAVATSPSPVGAPAPSLEVAESPLSGLPVYSPEPEPEPAAASQILIPFLVLTFCAIPHLLALLL